MRIVRGTSRPSFAPPAQLAFDFDKRWERRQQRWVAPDLVFSPDGFAVDVLETKDAKAYVCEHHYAGSYPPDYLPVGLFRSTGTGARLVGVAVFSVPINAASVPKYTGFAFAHGCDLGRFVLAPEVRFNGETWFLSRALDCLRREKPQLRTIVSYADPLERRHGQLLTKPAHYGTIYQAGNATYVGRATPRTLVLAPTGDVVSGRAIQKIRAEERGWRYAVRQLEAFGAPARAAGESLDAWVTRALNAPGFTRVRHPGNHTYLFGLDRAAKRQIAARHPAPPAYPKKPAGLAARAA